MENNNTIRHVNYASDFRVVFAFPDNKLPDYPWHIELKTPNTPAYNTYVASFDGSVYTRCVPLVDNSILVLVDRHHLAPGILCYQVKRDVPDSLFPDGEMNVTTPGRTRIELWDGITEELPVEQINTIIATLKGDSAYEIYKKYHPESALTEQEYADAPIDAAEKADQAADEATAAAEAATEAADKASEAAKSADDAAAGTIEATKDTIEATASANEAAGKANTAAENADTAAGSANEAAGNAIEAADAANIAAFNADAAAAKANTAAENADEQAGRAKDYADHPPKIVTVDDTNYWAFWDETKGDYVTSSVRSDGGPVFATFNIDPATMILSVNYQLGYGNGSEFQFSDGHLFYQIND